MERKMLDMEIRLLALESRIMKLEVFSDHKSMDEGGSREVRTSTTPRAPIRWNKARRPVIKIKPRTVKDDDRVDHVMTANTEQGKAARAFYRNMETMYIELCKKAMEERQE